MAKRNDSLYQPHPSKAAQIAERAEHDARLKELEKESREAETSTDSEASAPKGGAKSTAK